MADRVPDHISTSHSCAFIHLHPVFSHRIIQTEGKNKTHRWVDFVFLFEMPHCRAFTGKLYCCNSQEVISLAMEHYAHLKGIRYGVLCQCRLQFVFEGHVCMQTAEWVRLADCLHAALLLVAVLACWLEIKSRAGAVYVTWGRASAALQQLASQETPCMSFWCTSYVCETSPSVHEPVLSSCPIFKFDVSTGVGGKSRQDSFFIFSGPWNN